MARITIACVALGMPIAVFLWLGAAEADQAQQPRRVTDADFDDHIAALRRKLPEDDFHIVLAKPFVVIGDEPVQTVERRAQRTVAWAVRLLKKDYFADDPDHIINVWLFKDKDSYKKHTLELFGDKPTTPYGYYSPRHRALIMNIATGGGTLVHEIVHPFVSANFPKCPAWFNEGLGSLYEQCGERDGRIVGFENWRLAGLQKAIRNKAVGSFKDLTDTTTEEYYGPGSGLRYAQARYLCLYLERQKLLRKFYHAFHKNHEDDPTGYATLQSTLGDKDMAAFERKWMQWVMKLRYPPAR